MFRISRRLDYGLQLMIALAAEPESQPQSTATLADKLRIPLPFLHQIGHTLMQAGLVKASPGPHGGIRLNRAPESVSLMQIVETLEGPVMLQPGPDANEECTRQSTFSTQYTWDSLQEKVVDHLNSITLLDMVTTSQQGQRIPLDALKLTRSEYHI